MRTFSSECAVSTLATLLSFSWASLVSVAESNSKNTLTPRSCSSALSRSAWPCAWYSSAVGLASGCACSCFVSSCFALASGAGWACEQAIIPASPIVSTCPVMSDSFIDHLRELPGEQRAVLAYARPPTSRKGNLCPEHRLRSNDFSAPRPWSAREHLGATDRRALDCFSAARQRHVRPEDDDRADDRRDPATRGESPGSVLLSVGAEERVTDQPADERSDHSQDSGGEPSHRLTPWIDRSGKQADHEAEDDEADDVHGSVSRRGGSETTVSTAAHRR